MLTSRIGRHGLKQLNLSSFSLLQRVKPISWPTAGTKSSNLGNSILNLQPFNTSLTGANRGYATETSTEKPKAKTTRTVKRKRGTAKKTTKKSAAKKKTAKKPKRKVKKVATKAKARGRPKKALTVEEKKKLQVRELKTKALKPPHSLPSSAWTVLSAEVTKGSKGLVEGVKQAAVKYRNLVPEEKEHYNHAAHENKSKNDAAYKAWIQTHTPDQIRIANNARVMLRRLTGRSRHWSKLQDDRQVKRPVPPRLLFNTDRWASGDFNGMKITEVPQLLKREWNDLPASEKKSYEDTYKEAQAKYVQARAAVYATKPVSTRKRATKS